MTSINPVTSSIQAPSVRAVGGVGGTEQAKAKPETEQAAPSQIVEAGGSNEAKPTRVTASQATEKKAGVSEFDIEEAVEVLNARMKEMQRDIVFRIEREANNMTVIEVNNSDGELVRQIPSEGAIELAKRAKEGGDASGVLLETQI